MDSDSEREYNDNFISGNYVYFIGIPLFLFLIVLILLNLIKTNQNEVEFARDRVRELNFDNLFEEPEDQGDEDSSSSSSF